MAHSRFIPLILALSFTIACSEDEPTDPVPAPLRVLEGTAEDAYDQALANHAELVAKDATTLDTTWKGFRAQAVSDGVAEADAKTVDSAMSALGIAATSSAERVALARAANAVSAPMSKLYAIYGPKVPVAVLELDYLGRELELDGLENALAGASTHLDALDRTWTALRAQVVAAGGATQATAFDTSISDERAAIGHVDAAALSAAAHAQLDLVDAVEHVFNAADKPD
jgi:hypothetical protein